MVKANQKIRFFCCLYSEADCSAALLKLTIWCPLLHKNPTGMSNSKASYYMDIRIDIMDISNTFDNSSGCKSCLAGTYVYIT